METLGRFPADPKVVEGLAAIELEEGEVDHGSAPEELVLSHWLQGRRIATATVEGEFAAVGTLLFVGLLRKEWDLALPVSASICGAITATLQTDQFISGVENMGGAILSQQVGRE
jgi:hypothetical protein